jgi:hypothetical protein
MKLTGMMAALGHFISKLDEKGLPFFKLLKKADKFVWDEEAQKAFVTLKDSLTTPLLTFLSLTTKMAQTTVVT